MEEMKPKNTLRKRADEIREFRCKNLIAVIENPNRIQNIGTVIKNANTLNGLIGFDGEQFLNHCSVLF